MRLLFPMPVTQPAVVGNKDSPAGSREPKLIWISHRRPTGFNHGDYVNSSTPEPPSDLLAHVLVEEQPETRIHSASA